MPFALIRKPVRFLAPLALLAACPLARAHADHGIASAWHTLVHALGLEHGTTLPLADALLVAGALAVMAVALVRLWPGGNAGRE